MISIFVLTFFITTITFFKFFGLILGNDMSLSYDGSVFDISKAYWFYPSFLFQIWFWTDKLNIIG